MFFNLGSEIERTTSVRGRLDFDKGTVRKSFKLGYFNLLCMTK